MTFKITDSYDSIDVKFIVTANSMPTVTGSTLIVAVAGFTNVLDIT